MCGYISYIMQQSDILHVVENINNITYQDSYLDPIINLCLSRFPSLRDDTDMKWFQGIHSCKERGTLEGRKTVQEFRISS